MRKIIHLSLLCFFILQSAVAQTQSNNYSILVLDFSSNDIQKNIELLGNNYSFKSIFI